MYVGMVTEVVVIGERDVSGTHLARNEQLGVVVVVPAHGEVGHKIADVDARERQVGPVVVVHHLVVVVPRVADVDVVVAEGVAQFHFGRLVRHP